MKKILILPIFIILVISVQAHPIKMSTGKLEINSEEKTVFLSINFFIDDFESALRKLYPQPPFNYFNPDEYMIQTLYNYINKCFRITVENKSVDFVFYSITKMDDNVCQVKLSADFEKFKSIKKITVSNTLLFNSYRTQSNILHIYVNNQSSRILQFYSGDAIKVLRIDY